MKSRVRTLRREESDTLFALKELYANPRVNEIPKPVKKRRGKKRSINTDPVATDPSTEKKIKVVQAGNLRIRITLPRKPSQQGVFKAPLPLPRDCTLLRFNNQRIFLAAANCVNELAQMFRIPVERIVSLNSPSDSAPKGIPEKFLEGYQGLMLFQERLEKIANTQRPVIIHCTMGMQRTPVATAIYLMSKGMGHQQAIDAVTQAMQIKVKDFEFDRNGFYFPTMELIKESMQVEANSQNRNGM